MPNPLFARRIIRAIIGVCLLVLAAFTLLYFRQHSLVYRPRPYDETYAYSLPADGVEINYSVATTKYVAYYIPGKTPLPKRVWLAFCGNGSLALDWTTILNNYPWNGDAFLLVDYPGYGKNGGYAAIASTRASADAALKALTDRLHTDEDHLTLCAIGHSLGAAGAIEAMVCLLALQTQLLPPNINFRNADQGLHLNIVANESREAKVDIALSNSVGFGGTNASILIQSLAA